HQHETTKTRNHEQHSSFAFSVVRVCVSAVLVFASATFAQTRRPMTIDDVIDLVQVSAPRISPDGRRVIYTRSELGKWKDNKRVTAIWIADADGSNARRFLGNEKDRNAAWAPGGKSVAFLSTRDASAGPAAGTAEG